MWVPFLGAHLAACAWGPGATFVGAFELQEPWDELIIIIIIIIIIIFIT